MTSMPASRRARATTLAPRSCPSSPGLATTTRIRPCVTATSAPFSSYHSYHSYRSYRRAGTTRPDRPDPEDRARPDPNWEDTTGDRVCPTRPRPRSEQPVAEDRTRERVAYLPPKAAKARKLILRSQLGLPWILTAVLFGALILAAGSVFLVKGGRPGAPWAEVAPLTRLPDGAVTEARGPSGQVVVVDRRGGTLRAFAAAPGA